jgi:predicted RNA-binding protein with PUA-like domain
MRNISAKDPARKNFYAHFIHTEMTSRHWLIKFAPFRTSWAEIIARGSFTPRGIRSPQARKHLSSMRLGDSVLFYRSQQDQAIVGLLEVTREAYPDPTSADPQWLTCDFQPVHTLLAPVSLAELRKPASLRGLLLLSRPRLAAMPVSPAEYQQILSLSAP